MRPIGEFLVLAGAVVFLSLVCGVASAYYGVDAQTSRVFFRMAVWLSAAALLVTALLSSFVIWQDSRRGGAGQSSEAAPRGAQAERGPLPRKSPRRE